MDHLTGALEWWNAGFSVIPVVADGSKRPLGSWKNYQETRATELTVKKWWRTAPDQGVGIVCGAVSGHLEMTEIESARMGSEYWDSIDEAMKANGVHTEWSQLIDNGYTEITPSGGIHIIYRIADQPVPGNTKIAMDVTAKQTFAETRGEGGFVVVAPSSGTVHKSGESWAVASGAVGKIPTISWNVRCLIHTALREALDERVLPTYERPEGQRAYDRSEGDRPGDAFNDDPSVSIHDILIRNGWKYLGKTAGQDRYVHPLSSDMTTHSACTGHKGSPNLYAWSGFPYQDYYTKFGVLAHLEFNGDFSEASRYLRAQGYGSQRETLDISDWFEQTADDAPAGMGAVMESSTSGVEAQVADKAPTLEADGLPKLSGSTFKGFNWRESSLPKLFESTYHNHLKYVASSREWKFWDGTRWAVDGRTIGVRAAVKLLSTACDFADQVAQQDPDRGEILAKAAKSLSTMNKMKALSSLAQSSDKIAAEHSDFDRTEHLVTVDNGVLNLDTLELLPHDRNLMLSKKMNVAYDPDADSTFVDRIIAEWLPNVEVRAYVCRLLAVTLSGRADERVIPMLYGKSGSGKTAFLEAMYHIFGDFGAIASESALKPRPDHDGPSEKLHQLKGSRMVKLSELSQGSVLNEALVKSITGSDTQSTRKLYGEIEEWKVQYVVWLATNHLPTISSSDEAIWKRVKPINFPGCFVDATGNVENPENRDLGRKLAANHGSALLNWILDGLRDYQRIGLSEPAQIGEWLGQYRDEIDTARQFLKEAPDADMIVIDPNQWIGVRDLYRIYNAWCMDAHERPLSFKYFNQRMVANGWLKSKKERGIMWQGIGAKGFIVEGQRSASKGGKWW